MKDKLYCRDNMAASMLVPLRPQAYVSAQTPVQQTTVQRAELTREECLLVDERLAIAQQEQQQLSPKMVAEPLGEFSHFQ